MSHLRKINLLCFLVLILVFVLIQYCVDLKVFSNRLQPWHMGRSDSLSVSYLNKYDIFNQLKIYKERADSQVTVLILVDAWGVPFNETLMEKDFELFENENVKRMLHRRVTEFTQYAEQLEFKIETKNGVYLFGGDSMEYKRPSYVAELGYVSHLFCHQCDDEVMLNKVDSILNSPEVPEIVALTTQTSRDGDRSRLHNSLKKIAELMKKNPEVSFIVQGTHRPILCSAQIREQYYQHWVPAVMVNVK